MTQEIKRFEVPSMHVLTVRRRLEGQKDVAREIAGLLPSVSDILAGPPMALAVGYPRDGMTDYDLAFPVESPLVRTGFIPKTLPTLPMFSITHRGPINGGEPGADLSDTWNRFVAFARGASLLLGDDPGRFIYHEGLDSVGTGSERFVIEIQYAYHLPMWLDAFSRGVTRCVDGDTAARILAGSQGLADRLDGDRAARWIHGAIERFDEEVADESTRACVLNACAHHYIVRSAETMRELWARAGGDLRKMVELVTEEPSFGSAYWIDESQDAPRLMIRRRPARPEAYNEATDPVEKRFQACFCPLVRGAIRTGKQVSRTFCHCSGGWYAQEWENVFGEAPRVDLVDTMLEGADACLFAVHIPPGYL